MEHNDNVYYLSTALLYEEVLHTQTKSAAPSVSREVPRRLGDEATIATTKEILTDSGN